MTDSPPPPPLTRLVPKDIHYQVNVDVIPPNMMEAFHEFRLDDETAAFLDHCTSESIIWQYVKSAAASFLKGFGYSPTDSNAVVDRGKMFVISKEQAAFLLGGAENWKGKKILDIGAGDGNVTSVFAALAGSSRLVTATEAAKEMVKRLQEKGFDAVPARLDLISDLKCYYDNGSGSEPPDYDIVCCFNVLDRCSHPISLLKSIHQILSRTSTTSTTSTTTSSTKTYLLLTLVLPFFAFTEDATGQHQPVEKMGLTRMKSCSGMCCRNFERNFVELWGVLESLGFVVEKWGRIPYLCEGDGRRSYYVLDDAVLLLRVK